MILLMYSKENELLNISMKGKIRLEEMKSYFESFIKNHSLPRRLRILEDSRQAEFDFEIDRVDQINRIVGSEIASYQYIRHAMLRTAPMQTAYGIMQVELNDIIKYSPNVFSTTQSAIEWLNSPE